MSGKHTDKTRLYVFSHQRFVGSVLVENGAIHNAQHDTACIGYEDHRIFTQNAIARPGCCAAEREYKKGDIISFEVRVISWWIIPYKSVIDEHQKHDWTLLFGGFVLDDLLNRGDAVVCNV